MRKFPEVRRGDVFYADLSGIKGSEQGGVRPALIIQNDVGNRFAPTIIVAPITSQLTKANIPTHVNMNGELYGMEKESVILLEQVRTIDKIRLREFVTHIGDEMMEQVDKAIMISLGLIDVPSVKRTVSA
jgi:mRNA interferase MazF